MPRKIMMLGFFVVALFAAKISLAENAYFGIKFGNMDIDLGDASSPKNLGFMFGSNRRGGGFEGELTTTFSEGNYNIGYGFGSLDISVDTLALYGVYRSEGKTYFKAKAGILHERVDISGFSDKDTGFSAGIGLGVDLGSNALEFEYTVIEEDVNYLSVGLRF